MNRRYGVLIIAFIAVLSVVFGLSKAQARENYRGEMITTQRSMSIGKILSSKESCIQCHAKVTPRIVSQFKASAHSKIGVDCATCHGKDHTNMAIVTGKTVCARCHAKQTKEMLASKHANSWNNMWNNARYLNAPLAMQEQGCSRCHDLGVGFNDVKDVRCDYCHTTHEFSVKEAQSPAACNTCHMGPDHPQAEAYEESAHSHPKTGQVTGAAQNNNQVTCVTCHQPNGSHNISNNIGIGGVSNGAVLDSWSWIMDKGKPKMKRPVITQAQFDKARQGNLQICLKCHDQDFSQKWLAGSDQIKILADQQLLQASGLIKKLNKDGLLYPNPVQRAQNPIEGAKLVLGGNQLYTDTSKAEAIYFYLYKFAACQAWKSAYHQDFKRAGNIGLGDMQKLIGELKDENAVLRLLGPVDKFEVKKLALQAKADKKPNYILLGLCGLLLGALFAGATVLIKKKKTVFFTGILMLGILNVGMAGMPKQASAWDGKNYNQTQCVTCHKAQVQELKNGKHKGLKCLDCHTPGAKTEQVKKPETCGKCHSGAGRYQLETYMSSPHGEQYKVKGLNQWVPTCATCHMPKGSHAPITKLSTGDFDTKGKIGEVCLKCHITDDVVKFNNDMKSIYNKADDDAAALKDLGISLIEKGILVPAGSSNTDNIAQLKAKWGTNIRWKLVNADKLPTKEQDMAQKLVNQLDQKTKEGLNEDLPRAKIGVAHVNPDYTHWYGNAFLNLNLSEARGTAKELEMFAYRAGYTGENPYTPLKKGLTVLLGAVLGFGVFTLVYRKIKNKQR